jgi:hypothetical protein
MRWILISLLLLNTALFAWFLLLPVKAEQQRGEINIDPFPDLVLLSEVQAASSSRQFSPQASAGSDVVAACYELGPFADSYDTEQFALSEKDKFAMQIDNRQVQTRVDYRVYLSPYASRDAAETALEELRAKLQANNLAIDTLVITRGDLENGVALGLFSEQRNALNVESQLTRLGYEVHIIEELRTQEQLWISLLESPEGARLLLQWPVIQQQRPYLQYTEKLC